MYQQWHVICSITEKKKISPPVGEFRDHIFHSVLLKIPKNLVRITYELNLNLEPSETSYPQTYNSSHHHIITSSPHDTRSLPTGGPIIHVCTIVELHIK